METANDGPLTGIKILAISTMIAAPFGATLLADLGNSEIYHVLGLTKEEFEQLKQEEVI